MPANTAVEEQCPSLERSVSFLNKKKLSAVFAFLSGTGSALGKVVNQCDEVEIALFCFCQRTSQINPMHAAYQ